MWIRFIPFSIHFFSSSSSSSVSLSLKLLVQPSFSLSNYWLLCLICKPTRRKFCNRHLPLMQILSQEDVPLMWAIVSAGSLYRDTEEGGFCSLFPCPCCGIHHWHWTLLLLDTSTYRSPTQPSETEQLLDSLTFQSV